ncbi:hypothetical protein AMJ50_03025 [Parcubacteria bacterium DG_74_3]|nr:MAG: hypothetical protein AMJ50_03025 [Parcubacteria bacterium DG_74_3]
MIEPNVGITEMGVVIPEHYIKVAEIAKLRGLDPGFATKGLGLLEARIPYATSLENLIAQAVQEIDYKDVKRFYVGTESDPDMSKPLAVTALNKKLGLTVVPVQSKFACLEGVQALLLACEYSVSHGGKPAIAIAGDRSIYDKTDPQAEITGGCAAIAMRVELNPEILALDYQHIGQYAEDIDDFRIPLWMAPFPAVDGPLTKPAFLKCIKWAVMDWKKANPGFALLDRLDYFIVHVPFSKMVEWHMAMFWRHEKYGEEKHLTIEECAENPALWDDYKKTIDETRKIPEFQEFFTKKVKPGLRYNPHIGNCYTGSIFISLIAVLEKIKKNQELGMAAYGSGAGSLVVMGRAMKSGFQSNLKEQIDQKREELTLEQYEEWRERTLKEIRATPIF